MLNSLFIRIDIPIKRKCATTCNVAVNTLTFRHDSVVEEAYVPTSKKIGQQNFSESLMNSVLNC